jgi:hypothetical protein
MDGGGPGSERLAKGEEVLQLMYDAFETTGNIAFIPYKLYFSFLSSKHGETAVTKTLVSELFVC